MIEQQLRFAERREGLIKASTLMNVKTKFNHFLMEDIFVLLRLRIVFSASSFITGHCLFCAFHFIYLGKKIVHSDQMNLCRKWQLERRKK